MKAAANLRQNGLGQTEGNSAEGNDLNSWVIINISSTFGGPNTKMYSCRTISLGRNHLQKPMPRNFCRECMLAQLAKSPSYRSKLSLLTLLLTQDISFHFCSLLFFPFLSACALNSICWPGTTQSQISWAGTVIFVSAASDPECFRQIEQGHHLISALVLWMLSTTWKPERSQICVFVPG